jgi:hypothetical protein
MRIRIRIRIDAGGVRQLYKDGTPMRKMMVSAVTISRAREDRRTSLPIEAGRYLATASGRSWSFVGSRQTTDEPI